jgi:hypothetical protein
LFKKKLHKKDIKIIFYFLFFKKLFLKPRYPIIHANNTPQGARLVRFDEVGQTCPPSMLAKR